MDKSKENIWIIEIQLKWLKKRGSDKRTNE